MGSLLSFLHPRYCLLALLMGLLWLLTWLPHRWQLALGRGLGGLAFYLCTRRRRITATNIALCFADRSEIEQEAMVKACFQYAGEGLLEAAQGWWQPLWRLARCPFKITGLEHLKAAQAQHKGVLLLSGHFTCMELAGRLLSRQVPLSVVYRPHKNPLFERIMRRSRARYYHTVIARSDMRRLYRSLQADETVWYAADQDYGPKYSEFVEFFGQTAAIVTTVSRVARATGTVVVPLFQHRAADGTYCIDIQPALESFPSDNVSDAKRIAQLLETVIKRHPTQYYWLHRRFKSRPEGVSSVY